MADVFLSYARVDRALAEQVKAGLEAAGLTVFFEGTLGRCGCGPSSTSMDCSGLGISTLSGSASACSALQSMTFFNNSISVIPDRFFAGFGSISSINYQRNPVSAVRAQNG